MILSKTHHLASQTSWKSRSARIDEMDRGLACPLMQMQMMSLVVELVCN